MNQQVKMPDQPEVDIPHAHITVVVATRNRTNDLRRCLISLARASYPFWDLILVDQSDDDSSREITIELGPSLPQLNYRPMTTKGLSAARNKGLQMASGDIVAFLDDDCTVNRDWLACIASAFQRHPHAALVFGAVKSAPHDKHTCYIPEYLPRRERVMHGRWGYLHTEGIGASMCVRRIVTKRVGLFDVQLGAGASFVCAGEDNDYLYRCLALGYDAVTTPTISVEHYGARTYENGGVSKLISGYAYSSGVTDMKIWRCGEPTALLLFAVHGLYCLTRINLRNLFTHQGLDNTEWIVMYIRGLFASFQRGVDRQSFLYAKGRDSI